MDYEIMKNEKAFLEKLSYPREYLRRECAMP